ncbi:MAG TPA: hypothetical protein VKU00_27530 [Chthonomonadaceae bacterium]|nr:hypothetical protein [Chthonomonadaceae bacterium]
MTFSKPSYITAPENTLGVIGLLQEDLGRNWLDFMVRPFDRNGEMFGLKPSGFRLFIPTSWIGEGDDRLKWLSIDWKEQVEPTAFENGWTLLQAGTCIDPAVNYEDLASSQSLFTETSRGHLNNGLAEWNFDTPISGYNDDRWKTALSLIWAELMSLPYIPYSIQERRSVLAQAYNVLRPYINLWEAN